MRRTPRIIVIFHVLLDVKLVLAATVLTRVENLMLIHENSSTSVVDYWNLNRSDNNPRDDKHLMPIYQLITEGNFRSHKLDHWATNPPNEVAVMFFNNIGDLHFWLVFNTRNTSRDLDQWMKVDRLLGSLIMNMYQMAPIWSLPGYQFLYSSAFEPDKAWFAVTNRSILTGADEYPYFIIPLRDSVPFAVLPETEVVTVGGNTLLAEFGPFFTKDMIQIDLSGLTMATMVYIRAILTENMVSGSVPELYSLLYSTDICNTEDRVTYRSQDGNVLQLQTDKLETLETLRVRCLWLTFSKEMATITVKIYGPDATNQDFIQLPIMVFRGFWYGDGSETTVRPTTEDVQTTFPTTPLESTTQKTSASSQMMSKTDNPTADPSPTTPKLCQCANPPVYMNTSESYIEMKIQILKRTLAVNKTRLSSHVRKFISVPDGRASAAGIGYVAGVFLGLVFTTIVVLDLSSLFHYVVSLWKYVKENNTIVI